MHCKFWEQQRKRPASIDESPIGDILRVHISGPRVLAGERIGKTESRPEGPSVESFDLECLACAPGLRNYIGSHGECGYANEPEIEAGRT